MNRTIRAALTALVLALALRPAGAGEPQAGDGAPLEDVQRLRESGDVEKAAARAQELVRAAGAPLEVHLAYQDVMRDLGKDAALDTEYRARARAEGATADDLYLYARLLRGSKAVAQYRAALRADPAHFQATCGLANELLATGDSRGAERSFEAAKALRATSGLPWNGLGRAAEARGDAATAESCYRKAFELSPNLVVARVNLAVLLLAGGRTKEAADVLAAAQVASPKSPLPLIARGMGHLRAGREEDAAKDLEAALALDARSVATLNMLAATYLNLAKLDLAEKAVLRAATVSPDNVSTQVNLSSLRLAQGDIGGARTAADRAVALDAENAAAHFAVGRVLDRLNEEKKAESAYRRAVKADETNPVYVRALAQHLGRADRWKDAVKLFQRVVDLSRGTAESLYDLALAHIGASEPKRAADVLDQLVAVDTEHLNGWLKLGILCRERIRDDKRALRAFRSYLEKGGKDARVRGWITELEKTVK